MTESKEAYDPKEQEEIEQAFIALLRSATRDGAVKRAKGTKVSWKVDGDHPRGMYSHLVKWEQGHLVDEDSGAHPLVHAAWRALAIAWQETHTDVEEEEAVEAQIAGAYF